MNEDPKISVIMPVYQVKEYVGRAISSMQKQTLKEIEIFVVDDGSTDGSGEICDEYAKDDPRIHVIHKENEGAPSARNLAITKACGKYLYFCDADDWAEPEMLEDLYEIAESDDAQMVVSGFFIDTYYDGENYRTDDYIAEEFHFSTKEEFRRDAWKLFDKNMLYPPWNKLFKTSYIKENNITFPITFWDDFPFILDCIRDMERVSVTGKQYYHFLRKREESETSAYRPNMYEKREEEHQWMIELYKYWNVYDPESKEMIARRYTDRLLGCIENITNPKCTLSYSQKRQEIKRMISKRRVAQTTAIAKPSSLYLKLMTLPLKWQNVTLAMLEGKAISLVKTKNIALFSKLKAGR